MSKRRSFQPFGHILQYMPKGPSGSEARNVTPYALLCPSLSEGVVGRAYPAIYALRGPFGSALPMQRDSEGPLGIYCRSWKGGLPILALLLPFSLPLRGKRNPPKRGHILCNYLLPRRGYLYNICPEGSLPRRGPGGHILRDSEGQKSPPSGFRPFGGPLGFFVLRSARIAPKGQQQHVLGAKHQLLSLPYSAKPNRAYIARIAPKGQRQHVPFSL